MKFVLMSCACGGNRVSSIQSITASNPMPIDLAKKLGKNGVIEILSVLWAGYYVLRADNIISSDMDENEITEEWFMRVNKIWHRENRALRVSVELAPVLQHGDKALAKSLGQPPTIDFCFRTWEIKDEYYGVECKNLYESDQSHIKRYVETGVGNYISGRYGSRSSVSSIAGYILSGSADSIISELREEMSSLSPHMNLTKELRINNEQYRSMHVRKIDGICITIHHLFLEFVK